MQRAARDVRRAAVRGTRPRDPHLLHPHRLRGAAVAGARGAAGLSHDVLAVRRAAEAPARGGGRAARRLGELPAAGAGAARRAERGRRARRGERQLLLSAGCIVSAHERAVLPQRRAADDPRPRLPDRARARGAERRALRRGRQYPEDSIRALIEAGLYGIWVPEEHGGSAMGALTLAPGCGEVAAARAATGT